MVVFKLEICTYRLTNLCLNSLSIAIARGSGLRKLGLFKYFKQWNGFSIHVIPAKVTPMKWCTCEYRSTVNAMLSIVNRT